MTKDTAFSKELKDYLEDVKTCNGIIIPNKFNLYRKDNNKVIGKIGNMTVVQTEQIIREYAIIGKYVLSALSKLQKFLPYAIVSYIAETIKFNSNIIKISPDIIRGYTCISGLNARTYSQAMSILMNYSVIAETSIKHVYAVNPIAIYKGVIFKFLEINDEHKLSDCIIEDDKLIIDKAVIVKDKKGLNTELIRNAKYSDRTFNFNKKF